jgi:hypothetical protein
MDEEDYVYVVLKNVVIPPNAGTVEPTAAKFSVDDTGGKLLSNIVKLKNALSNKLGLDVTSTTSGDIHTFTSVDKFTLKISPQGGNRLDAELNIDESRDLGETLQIIDEAIDEVLLFTINGTRDYKLLSAKIPTNVNIFRNLALRLTDILAPMYRFDTMTSKPLILSNKNGNQIYIVTPPGPYDHPYVSNGVTPSYYNGFVSFNIYATNTNGRLASDEELIAIAKDVANAIKKVIADGPSYVPPPPPPRQPPRTEPPRTEPPRTEPPRTQREAPPPPLFPRAGCAAFLKGEGITTRKDFRKWALKNHPDRGGDTAKFQFVSDCVDQSGARRRTHKRKTLKRKRKTLKRK